MPFSHLSDSDRMPLSKKLEIKELNEVFFDTFHFQVTFLSKEVLHWPEQVEVGRSQVWRIRRVG